jgi:CheY-like chemotaxis protein
MTDRPPAAALTPTLLARKGRATPSFADPRGALAGWPAAPTAVVTPIRPDGPWSNPRPRVVAVAADILGRKLLRALIAARGCEVAMVGPQESPFAQILRNRPDLVVVDLDIGALPARDLSTRIKADRALRGTKVVAVVDPLTPAGPGYDGSLAKPVSAQDVDRTLAELVRSNPRRSEAP